MRPLLATGVLVGAAVGSTLGARRAQAGEVCHLEGVHLRSSEAGQELRVHTDCAPAFHALRLNDPPRLVVDLDQGEVGAMAGTLPIGGGTFRQLVVQQAGDTGRPVGRLELALARPCAPEVTREGFDIVVRASAAKPAAGQKGAGTDGGADPLAIGSRAFVPSTDWPVAPAVDAAAAEATARPRLDAQAVADVVASVQSAAATPRFDAATSDRVAAFTAPADVGRGPAEANPDRAAAGVGVGEIPAAAGLAAGVVAAAPVTPAPATERPAPPARRRRPVLRGLRVEGDGVWLALVGTPAYTTARLDDPPRLVVDLPAARPGRRRVRLRGRQPWLKGVRLGELAPPEGGLRVVFDLVGQPAVQVVARGHGLWVGPAAGAAAEPHATGPAAAAARLPGPAERAPTRLTQLRAERRVLDGRTETSIFLGGAGALAAEVDAQNARAWILTVRNAALPARLEGPVAQAGGPGAVSLVSAYQAQKDPAEVQLVVSLRGRAAQRLERVPGGLVWRIEEATGRATTAEAVHGSGAYFRTGAFRADAPALSASGARAQLPGAAANSLRNHRISLDVKDADVVNVLRLISEETGENIIASDEVKGKITLKLRDVPAEQALDTVLRIKSLDRVRHNNILRIASAETIQKERDLDVARKKALIEVEEVGIKMVTVNYATATEVIEQLKPMLSARGSLQVDQRTNTVIVQDVVSNVDRLIELARRLDKQTPLVNIQARIVEASSNFARDLGVQWGGAAQHTARTGNPTGVYFPADVVASGAADLPVANQTGGVVNPARYAVNFPALLSGQGAGLGFVLGSAGGAQLLDLRLSAMESNGNGRIISSPEVSTLDNKTARVSQGIQIPVSTVSAAGTMTRFVPAVLQLEVTPHVTNDGTVLMKIHVEKSAPDFTNKGGQGDPTINTRQADTEVLVRDGDTSVIGGILTRETSESRSEVPFLARIPILGSLFRRHTSAENRAELLVFITPRIINREASTVQAGSVFDRQNN